MNRLYVGFSKSIELPKGSFLYIDDDVPAHPKAKVFDPLKHSFNPLRHIDKKRAREHADALYTASPPNFLGELPVKRRQQVLLRSQRLPSGTTLRDAETLAEYAGLVPGTIGFTDFV